VLPDVAGPDIASFLSALLVRDRLLVVPSAWLRLAEFAGLMA